jgi:hypothetical protein
MLRPIYLVSGFPRGRESKADSSRERKNESPLVRKRQTIEQMSANDAEAVSAHSPAVKLLRHSGFAGSKGRRHTAPHSTWFTLHEKLRHADIVRKADLQTIASFLRLVLPNHRISEPSEMKLRASSSPRNTKTSWHVKPGEFSTEENA